MAHTECPAFPPLAAFQGLPSQWRWPSASAPGSGCSSGGCCTAPPQWRSSAESQSAAGTAPRHGTCNITSPHLTLPLKCILAVGLAIPRDTTAQSIKHAHHQRTQSTCLRPTREFPIDAKKCSETPRDYSMAWAKSVAWTGRGYTSGAMVASGMGFKQYYVG